MSYPRWILLCACAGSLLLAAATLARAASETAATAQARPLSLEEALAIAFRNRPELAALRQDLLAIPAKRSEAGQWPNPELGVELDNLASNLDEDDEEVTISLQQPLETGGKRQARLRRVAAEAQLLSEEFNALWLEVAAEVRLAYIEVLAGRERLALLREAERVAMELAEIARIRVEAGELAATEENRAGARLALTATETARESRRLHEAEQLLAAAVGEPGGITAPAETGLSEEPETAAPAQLEAGLNSSPRLARLRREVELRSAELAVEKSGASPDPTWFLALRETPDQDGHAVTLGVSLPLPLFRQNQGARAEAGARSARSELYLAAEERRAAGELARARATYAAALQESRTLQEQVIVRAEEAGQAVLDGFRQGKFRYSDVLESSQALLEARLRRLETLAELHRAAVSLDRLAGQPLPPSAPINERSTP